MYSFHRAIFGLLTPFLCDQLEEVGLLFVGLYSSWNFEGTPY